MKMMEPSFAGKPITAGPYFPGRAQHRRVQSETHFRFPYLDDILLDDVMVELNLDLPPTPPPPPAAAAQDGRTLSVDADFFEGLWVDDQTAVEEDGPRRKHRHSNSMDGYSSATWLEVETNVKMAAVMAADKLSQLALLDPKRAKRIHANRQSAARSKERKIRYMSELERKVQTLQTEATTLSAQITLLQRESSGLKGENKELKLKLHAMEQQANLRDALNEALRNELHQLKIAAGQVTSSLSLPPASAVLSSHDHPRLNGFQDFNGRPV